MRFKAETAIRRLVDEVMEPPSLVLEKLDADLLRESWKAGLGSDRVRQVAWCVWEALRALHEAGFVHTGLSVCLDYDDTLEWATEVGLIKIVDVKSDNILVNHGGLDRLYAKVVLSDYGDTVDLASLPTSDEGQFFGFHTFRSPEAMLNLKWGAATDIWSLGATLISLIWGKAWHIFKPEASKASIDDPTFPIYVIRRHDRFFGPFPISYTEFADSESLSVLEWVTRACERRTSFARASETEISGQDRIFICKMMKLDPRKRPSAMELLRDEWFAAVRPENPPNP